jgi:hypothetical protein
MKDCIQPPLGLDNCHNDDPIITKVVSSLIRICGGGIPRQCGKVDTSQRVLPPDENASGAGIDVHAKGDHDSVEWVKQLELLPCKYIPSPCAWDQASGTSSY